jgi:nitrous-oxide reductase
MIHESKRLSLALIVASLALLGLVISSCGGTSTANGSATGSNVQALMSARDLTEADVTAALKTYTPTGAKDEYMIFASGGHGGNVIVIGVPSMRIHKYIAVFGPEPWQGYGYGDQTSDLLASGNLEGEDLGWGDVHHPALSETAGDYDGEYLFVNDKANARIAVIDLKDFATKQIVQSGLIESDHGGCFVTPNTEYIIEGTQYPAPFGGEYAPISEYKTKYRGAVIFWKFDREKGRINKDASFAIELPPYMQDLADAGKLATDGWMFLNSFNTEMAVGGNLDGEPPLESGASQNDMDYMSIINWRKAAEIAADSANTTMISGLPVISIDTAVANDLLYEVPEPKSPHGCDVTPDGTEIVVAGKLDTHATVYNWEMMKGLIDAKDFVGNDTYGIPILDFQKSIRGQVEIGLGPLHTQFDGDGNAYTSVFIETVVAKWSLKDLKVIEKLPVHYNIGHLMAAEGDTVSPDGKYVVAMNKWALDRFQDVGPLLPQNFQLVDISGENMQLLYDMPLPLGEPHYAQMIKSDKLHPERAYPVGTDPLMDRIDPFAVAQGTERIERKADGVHVYMTAVRSHFKPDTFTVKKGETVHLHLTNIETAHDATHGFCIGSYNINVSLEPGEHSNMTFVADRAGVFPMYCTEFCSALHLEMAGYFLVEG